MNIFLRYRSPVVQTARLAALAVTVACATTTHAALLVYEGFTGYTAGALEGQNPNDNTVGLNKTVGYYDGATTSRAGGYTLTTGLTLGSLQTSGGALSFSGGTNVIGANLNVATATGTLWSSYLVNLSLKSTFATGDGATIRIGTKPSDSGTTSHFNSWADSRASSNNVAVGYGSTGTNGANGLSQNTTYIIVNRFTNVGGSGGGTATLWAFTEAQFAAFSGKESDIGSATVTATASNTLTGSFIFSSTQAFGIVTVADSGVYDELRFGSSLADVIPTTAIPEPAATALLTGLGGGLLLLARRRGRRAANN